MPLNFLNTGYFADKVGIGTNSPDAKLHVEGGIGIFNVSDDWQQSTLGTYLFRGANFATTISNETSALKIFPAYAGARTVGEYWGGINFMHLDPENSTWGTTYTGAQFWVGGRITDLAGQELSALVFAVNSLTTTGSQPTEKMVILPNGNVGIGADDPSAKLDVRQSNAGNIISAEFDNTDYTANNRNAIKVRQQVTAGGSYSAFLGVDKETNNIFLSNDSITADHLVIDTSGFVGIGATSPGAKLEVAGATNIKGTSNFAPVLTLGTAGAINAVINSADEMFFNIDSDNNQTSAAFWFGHNSTQGDTSSKLMVIKDSGRVGIGTDSPSVGLQLGNSTLGETKTAIFNSEGGGEVGLTVQSRTNRAKLRVADNDSNAYVVAERGEAFFGTSPNGDTQNLMITPSGYMSFGSVSEIASLYIQSSFTDAPAVKFYNSSTVGDGLFVEVAASSSSEFALKVTANGGLTNVLYARADGNVGIGTDSPGNLLDVAGDTDISGQLFVQHSGSYTAKLKQLATSMSNATYTFEIDSTAHTSNMSTAGAMSVDVDSGRAFTINGLGNVGMGTTSPAAGSQLTLRSSASTGITILSASNTGECFINFSDNDDANVGQIFYGHSPDRMVFRVGDDSRMTILGSNGNVGIGVTAPNCKFHVVSTSTAEPTVRLASTGYTYISYADPYHGLILRGIPSTYNTYGVTAGDQMSFLEYGGDFRFYQKNGLGTLENQGQLLLGTWTVKGDVIAYGSPSDKRLKENIKPIESALDKVSKLQGVTFDWKESDSILDIKEDIGFIAQDVQKVIPELVRENEDGMLSMRHQGIAPILLEAIKELKSEIEELKLNNCNCNK
jgi:hypothetical protein